MNIIVKFPTFAPGIPELSPLNAMLILLDPAHGHNTPGKRSPDGTLATCLYQSARHTLKGKTIRTDYARDGDPDWEENFYILRHTHCPAVLIENFFMDNKQDLAYLLSQEGRREIIETIIDGIERCVLTLVSG